MCSCAVHWLAVAVLTKYIVPVCVAPSESNSVSEVAWLKVFGSLGSNTATGGGVALAGRLSMYSTLAVAAGAESVVSRRRSERPPVLKPPPASGGYTCRRWPVGIHHVAVAIHLEGAGARVGQRAVRRRG